MCGRCVRMGPASVTVWFPENEPGRVGHFSVLDPIINGGAPLLTLFEKWLAAPVADRVFCHNCTVRAVTAATCLLGYSSTVRRNLKRFDGSGDLHFITCSCYRREPFLGAPARRDLFLTTLLDPSYCENRSGHPPPMQSFTGDGSTQRPPLRKVRVQSHDMLYSLSRDILYSFGTSSNRVSQRMTAVECWLLKSSSRIKVWQ